MPNHDASPPSGGSPDPHADPDAWDRIRRLARSLAPWAVGLALILGGGGLFPELVRRAAPVLLYHPVSLPPEQSSPGAWGIPRGEELWLRTDDGVRIHGWWIPAPAEHRRGTLLFLHGNAGHIGGRAPLARDLAGAGLDVLMVDYRGYGRSGGSPSEEGLYLDAGAAYRHLREERGVPAGELAVAGHSLGGAVAAHLAAGRPVGAAVVTASFTDLSDAARAVYPWLPDAWFRWEPPPFPTVRRMRALDAPVLVGRGGGDQLIPRSQVRALHDSAAPPRQWVEVAGAGHGDLWFEEEFRRALLRFLSRHLSR